MLRVVLKVYTKTNSEIFFVTYVDLRMYICLSKLVQDEFTLLRYIVDMFLLNLSHSKLF